MKEFLESKNKIWMENLSSNINIEDQVGYLEDKGSKMTENMRKN